LRRCSVDLPELRASVCGQIARFALCCQVSPQSAVGVVSSGFFLELLAFIFDFVTDISASVPQIVDRVIDVFTRTFRGSVIVAGRQGRKHHYECGQYQSDFHFCILRLQGSDRIAATSHAAENRIHGFTSHGSNVRAID
jgi:hypothetical protein